MTRALAAAAAAAKSRGGSGAVGFHEGFEEELPARGWILMQR